MPPGRRQTNPAQQLILKAVMVGFVCITILALYRSCSKQQRDHQSLLEKQNQNKIDAAAAEAEARKHEADVEKLRIQRQREQDANQTSVKIAQLQAQVAASKEHREKEGDALKELHRAIPENKPVLLSGNYSIDNQAGRIMHLRHDDRLLLTRKPADEDGKSEYDLKWSSGITQLKEVINAADNGLPQFSLVEKLENIKARQMGWSDVKVNYGTNGFSGRYRYEYGIDGLTFEDGENSKYKVAVARAKEGYAGAKAGMDSGDSLVQIGGVSVENNTIDQIERKLTSIPGSRLAVRIFRNQPDPVSITLVKAKNGNFGTPCIGARKTDVQSNEATIFFVQENSEAAKAGIHVGDVITEIDKSSVRGLSDKEVSDRLLGGVGEIKILHVSHFIDTELQYDQKGEETVTVEMPIVQSIAQIEDPWSSKYIDRQQKWSRKRDVTIDSTSDSPNPPITDFPKSDRHMAVIDDSKDPYTNLRELPSTSNESKILAQMSNGEVVRVMEERPDGWLAVLRESGQTGFIGAKNCKAQDETAYPQMLEFITRHFVKLSFNRGDQPPNLTNLISDYASTVDYLNEGIISKQAISAQMNKYFSGLASLKATVVKDSYKASQSRYNVYSISLWLYIVKGKDKDKDEDWIEETFSVDVHLSYDKANNAHFEIRRQKEVSL